MTPGAPFWAGFTAFCSNEVALFVLEKVGDVDFKKAWVATAGSLFVGGAVYGRAKVDEFRKKNGVRRDPGQS